MTRFFDLDEANAALPEVRAILESLRDERAELIRLRDQVCSIVAGDARRARRPRRTSAARRDRPTGRRATRRARDGPTRSGARSEVRVLRLRMQGVIDQMQAGVARIDELGITLREIETGLIDFPALASGRQIWLCWRLGEDDVEWWHELGDGFGGRQRRWPT